MYLRIQEEHGVKKKNEYRNIISISHTTTRCTYTQINLSRGFCIRALSERASRGSRNWEQKNANFQSPVASFLFDGKACVATLTSSCVECLENRCKYEERTNLILYFGQPKNPSMS